MRIVLVAFWMTTMLSWPCVHDAAAQTGQDSVFLRNGNVMVGTVQTVRTNDVVFWDATSGLSFEFPKSEVARIRTRTGHLLSFQVEGVPRDTNMVMRGVGGVYTVTSSYPDEQGSPVCLNWVRQHFARTGTIDVTVVHQPGSSTISWGGTAGAVNADGTFVVRSDGNGQILTISGRFTTGAVTGSTVLFVASTGVGACTTTSSIEGSLLRR